jgi:ribonuclease BN (tRNA processing enzyme)
MTLVAHHVITHSLENIMKMKFIGVGGMATNIAQGHSNMLLTENGKHMLIDCGKTAEYILRDDWKMSHSDIDAIWISHLHSDHVGSLEWLAIMNYFAPRKNSDGSVHRVKLYTIRELMKELWENTLKGGLETVEGKITTLTDWFDCRPISGNEHFEWQGYKFQPVQTIHVMAGYMFRYSYGLLITNPITKKITFVTTDTQFCPNQLHHFYKTSDVIFQDTETAKFKSNVHAHYNDLKTLDSDVKSKMWMYHYANSIETWKEDGFAGFVSKGQEFDI